MASPISYRITFSSAKIAMATTATISLASDHVEEEKLKPTAKATSAVNAEHSQPNASVQAHLKKSRRADYGGVPSMSPAGFMGPGAREKRTSGLLENPLIPVGMGATIAALIYMIRSSVKGDGVALRLSMQYRIIAQFFTFIVLLVGASLLSQVRKHQRDREEKKLAEQALQQ